MIKNLIDGIHVEDQRLNSLVGYFILAKEFGWTPEQVDKIDYVLIEDLLTMLHRYQERKNEKGAIE